MKRWFIKEWFLKKNINNFNYRGLQATTMVFEDEIVKETEKAIYIKKYLLTSYGKATDSFKCMWLPKSVLVEDNYKSN